jgi:hypothetical protein
MIIYTLNTFNNKADNENNNNPIQPFSLNSEFSHLLLIK